MANQGNDLYTTQGEPFTTVGFDEVQPAGEGGGVGQIYTGFSDDSETSDSEVEDTPDLPSHVQQRERQRRRRLRNKKLDENCWGCLYGDDGVDAVSAPALSNFIRMFTENFDKVSMRALSKSLAEYHKKEIREPMLQAGESCGRFSARSIRRHFNHHVSEPCIILRHNINTLRSVIRDLKKNGKKFDADTQQYIVDKSNVDLLLRTQKQLMELMKCDPKKMTGYNPGFRLDEPRVTTLMRVDRPMRWTE